MKSRYFLIRSAIANLTKLSVLFLFSLVVAACSANTSNNSPAPDITAPADRALEAEGKTMLGALRRGQQAYFLEHQEFSETIEDLGLGIGADTQGYAYKIAQASDTEAHMTATAKNTGAKSYTASLFAIGEADLATTVSIICETDAPSATPPDFPPTPNTKADLACAPNSSPIE